MDGQVHLVRLQTNNFLLFLCRMIGVRDAGKRRRKGRDRLNDIGRNREMYRERDRGRNGGRDRGRDFPVVNTLGSPYSLV
jgi:hypothetical protein